LTEGRVSRTVHGQSSEFEVFEITKALRVSVVKQMAEIYAASAKWTLSLIPQADLPMPAAIFVRVLHALIEGLTYQRFLTPELVTDDVIFAAFDAIATVSPRGAPRPSAPHAAARTRKQKSTKVARQVDDLGNWRF
jgi:hypothetical protein